MSDKKVLKPVKVAETFEVSGLTETTERMLLEELLYLSYSELIRAMRRPGRLKKKDFKVDIALGIIKKRLSVLQEIRRQKIEEEKEKAITVKVYKSGDGGGDIVKVAE